MAEQQKKDLTQRYQLTQDVLNQPVSEEHILEIRKTIPWRDVGPYLLGTGPKFEDIHRDGHDEEDKRRLTLAKWQETEGNDATYDRLIEAMVKAEKNKAASEVCYLIKPASCTVQPLPEPSGKAPSKKDKKPTMPQLENLPGKEKKINVVERIGSDYESFGIQLLKDDDGVIVSAIEDDHRGSASKTTKAILRRWLGGTGMEPTTWGTLVDVLRTIGLKSLANDISEALDF